MRGVRTARRPAAAVRVPEMPDDVGSGVEGEAMRPEYRLDLAGGDWFSGLLVYDQYGCLDGPRVMTVLCLDAHPWGSTIDASGLEFGFGC